VVTPSRTFPARPRASRAPLGRYAGLLVGLALLLGPVAVADADQEAPSAGAAGATVRTTTGPDALLVSSAVDRQVRLVGRSALEHDEVVESAIEEVVVDTSRPQQVWRGVGAALTDASVLHLQARPDLVPLLFGDDDGQVGLDWIRLPLTATDMSTQVWSWRSTAHGARPTAPARPALRLLRQQVLPLAPDLQVVGSAWTAPPAYKTPAAWFGGRLRDDRVADYARFLAGQARWLVRHGVPLAAMTLGNEPGHTADYPTMAISDAQLAELGRLVGPRLDPLGVELWGLDHNWDDVSRVAASGTEGLDAVALHCYAGRPAQAATLTLPWLVTECTGTDDGFRSTFAWDSRHLVADAVAAGSTGLMMWNLALSPGWHGAFGGCHTCRGLVTVGAGGEVVREPEFFTLAHLRRAAPPGSSVVPVTGPTTLQLAGFASPAHVGVYGYNDSDATRTVRIGTADGAFASVSRVGPHEMFTWVAQR